MQTALLGWMIWMLSQPAGSVPIDIAPPVGVLAGISLAAMAVLCLFVVGIILAAVLIIRGIKKNRVKKGLSDSSQK
jgi:hypothetical protein